MRVFVTYKLTDLGFQKIDKIYDQYEVGISEKIAEMKLSGMYRGSDDEELRELAALYLEAYETRGRNVL